VLIEFGLLVFCWGFLYLCSSRILACSFLFLFLSLSNFGLRVVLALRNVFGRIPFFLTFCNYLRRIGINCLNVWLNLTVKPSGPRFFFDRRLFITDSISWLVMGLLSLFSSSFGSLFYLICLAFNAFYHI
jgi:hypothetical protein